MADEQAFLDLLKANPHDRPTRLVYADWLEERGDPRATFLREHFVTTNRCPVCATEVSGIEFWGTRGEVLANGNPAQIAWQATCDRCDSDLLAIDDGREYNPVVRHIHGPTLSWELNPYLLRGS